MAPGGKGSGLDTAFPRQFRNQMRRNEVANLAEDGEVRGCWVDGFVFHLCRVADFNPQSNTFSEFLGDGCDKIFNRDNSGKQPTELSKLDVLSLKKLTTKWSKKWKRDAAKAGGLRHIKFVFDEDNPQKRTIKQKCRGSISDVPGQIIEKRKADA